MDRWIPTNDDVVENSETREGGAKIMQSAANTTTDHTEIQGWIEERGGVPSVVRVTHRAGGRALTS